MCNSVGKKRPGVRRYMGVHFGRKGPEGRKRPKIAQNRLKTGKNYGNRLRKQEINQKTGQNAHFYLKTQKNRFFRLFELKISHVLPYT